MEANSDPDLQRTPTDKKKYKTTKNVQNRPDMQVTSCNLSVFRIHQ